MSDLEIEVTMVTRKDDKIVLYPEYFQKGRSRAAGRRVYKKLAVPTPNIDEIVRAADKLGLHPVVEAKSHPRSWYRKGKRVLIGKKGKKTGIIKDIAKRLKG